MTQLVTINAVTLEQIIHEDTPVVTVQQIADVHGISAENVQKSFQRHRTRFTEGKHYFRLDFTEASQLGLRVQVSANGLIVFTEKGYLLLAKPLRDDTAWDVQERMVDDYFALKSHAPQPTTSAEMHLAQAYLNIEFERRQDALEARQQATEDRVTAIEARRPPVGKEMIGTWLRYHAKPRLNDTLMKLLKAACRRLEKPAEFRPDGFEWPQPYYTPETIEAAYEDITKQLSFLCREDRVPYGLPKRRTHRTMEGN